MHLEQLGNICEVVRGSSPRPQGDPRYYGGSIPRLMIADVTRDRKYVTPKIDSLTVEGAKKSRPMKKGDLIIAVSGDPGRVCFLNVDACIHDGFVGLRNVDESKFSKEFLYYYLTAYKSTMAHSAYGAIFQNLTTDLIKKIKLPSFPLPKQLHIAQVLSKAENLVARRKESLLLLNEFLQSTFVDWFGDPVQNDKGFPKKRFGDFVDEIIAGSSYGGEQRELLNNDEFGVLKISSVTLGVFNPKEFKAVQKKDIRGELIHPKQGDLLFSRANTRELVGATCIVDKDYPRLFLPDKLWNLVLNDQLNKVFVHFLFQNKSFRKKISREATGTSGSMLNISMEKLRNIRFHKPPGELQIRFAEIVGKTEVLKRHYEQSLHELTNLYGSLSQNAFARE